MISLIVATGERGEIGRGNALPWRLPADLRWFRRQTLGKPLLMGRRTHDSIGRPLPGRCNIVLSRDRGYRAPGCTVVGGVDEALAAAGGVPEVMVIGGASLYALTLPRAARIYLTRVHGRFEADTFFPPLDPSAWRERERSDFAPDARNPHAYSFVILERLDAPGATAEEAGR